MQTSLLHVDAAEVHGQNATTAYIRGNISAVKGQLKQALYHYSDCLTMDSSHIRARLNRSSVYMGLDDAQKALDDAETLLDFAPQLAVARIRKGMLTCTSASGIWAKGSSTCLNKPHHTHALTQRRHATWGWTEQNEPKHRSTKPCVNHPTMLPLGTSVVCITCTST